MKTKKIGKKYYFVGVTAAAKAIGIKRNTLYYKVRDTRDSGFPWVIFDKESHKYLIDVEYINKHKDKIFPPEQPRKLDKRIESLNIKYNIGVYKIENENEIYIGKSKVLSNRLKTHFNKKFNDPSYKVSILKEISWGDIKNDIINNMRRLFEEAKERDGKTSCFDVEEYLTYIHDDMLENFPNNKANLIDNELCFWECYYIREYEENEINKKLLNCGTSKEEYPLDYVTDIKNYLPLKYTTRYTQWQRREYIE